MGSSQAIPPVTSSGVLFEDDHLRVRFVEGKSNDAIISFSGVGAEDYRLGDAVQLPGSGVRNAAQIDEFRKTIGDTRNVYYVADKHRGWYNGLEDKILDLLN